MIDKSLRDSLGLFRRKPPPLLPLPLRDGWKRTLGVGIRQRQSLSYSDQAEIFGLRCYQILFRCAPPCEGDEGEPGRRPEVSSFSRPDDTKFLVWDASAGS